MSHKTSRAAIMAVIAQIQADWTEYPLVVESDNRSIVDQAAQSNPYLLVEIDFMGADQADLGDRPMVKQTGQILVGVMVKANTGENQTSDLIDFITPYLDMKDLGAVRTHPVEVHRDKEILGWQCTPLLINFWLHRVSV